VAHSTIKTVILASATRVVGALIEFIAVSVDTSFLAFIPESVACTFFVTHVSHAAERAIPIPTVIPSGVRNLNHL